LPVGDRIDCEITKTYAPILGTGLVGGLIAGWAAGEFTI
jgi:hypothetical protein